MEDFQIDAANKKLDLNDNISSKNKNNHGLKFTVVIVVFAVTVGTSFGIYNTAVVNNLKPAIVAYLNETQAGYRISYDPETVWSLVVAAYPLGCGIGTLCSAFFAESVGRKITLMLSACLNGAGGLTAGFYLSVFELSIGGRLVMGAGLGLGMPVASAFITEIAPLHYRGACNVALQVSFALGDVFGMVLSLPQLLGTLPLSKFAMAFMTVPSVVTLIILAFAHESPRYLILKLGQLEKGKKALHFYQSRVEAREVFDEILSERQVNCPASDGKTTAKHFLKFLSNTPLKPLAIVCGCFSVPMLSGIAIVMGYSTDAFIDNGVSLLISPYFSLSLAICNLVSSVACLRLVELLGRRTLVKLGTIGIFVGPLSFTVLSLINIYVTQRPYWFPYLLVICLNVYAFFYSFLNSSCFALAAEVCSQNYRSYALAVGNFVAMLMSTTVILTYEPIRRHLGVSWVYFPFNFLSFLLGLLLFFAINETAGVTLTNIKRQFVAKK